jgi:cytochrome P450
MTTVQRVNTNSLFLTFQSVFSPFETLDRLFQDYGNIFETKVFGLPPTVLLSHPEDIQEIFTRGYSFFDSGETNALLKPFLGDQSLLLLDGQFHQRHKKLLTPSFSSEAIKSYGLSICKITERVISQWRKDENINVCAWMREISLRIILQLIWGVEAEQLSQIKQLTSQWLDIFSSPLKSTVFFFPLLRQNWGKWSPWGRTLELRQQIDEFIYQEINQRRQKLNQETIDSNPPIDILSLLLTSQDEAGQFLTDQELRDELITILFAGHETTTAALCWLMYWVHHQPQVRQKLVAELESGKNLTPYEITKFPYLTAVCQESLRIYPVILMGEGRILKQPLKLRDYEFMPGAVFMPCIYLLHHRKELYPNPNQFKPERFLEKKFTSFEYMPFGGGNRRCLGMNLALFEMKLILATILQKWQLQLFRNQTIKPIRKGTVMISTYTKLITYSLPKLSRTFLRYFSKFDQLS